MLVEGRGAVQSMRRARRGEDVIVPGKETKSLFVWTLSPS